MTKNVASFFVNVVNIWLSFVPLYHEGFITVFSLAFQRIYLYTVCFVLAEPEFDGGGGLLGTSDRQPATRS